MSEAKLEVEKRISKDHRELKLMMLFFLLSSMGIAYVAYEIQWDAFPETKIDEILALLSPNLAIIFLDFVAKTAEKVVKLVIQLVSTLLISGGGIILINKFLENEANYLMVQEQLSKRLSPELTKIIMDFVLRFPSLVRGLLDSLLQSENLLTK